MSYGRWLLGSIVVAGFGASMLLQQRALEQQAALLVEMRRDVRELGQRPPLVQRVEVGVPSGASAVAVAPTNASTTNSATAATPNHDSPNTPPVVEAPPRTFEQEQAAQAARQTVDTALASGHLGREDVMRMRAEMMESGDPAAAHELRRQLAVAINTGKLTLEPGVTLF